MLLDENNYKEQIHAFTQQDWQPLIELIPKVESTSKFGEWEEEDILFPYCIEAPIVSQFLHIVYRLPIIIGFDWGAWMVPPFKLLETVPFKKKLGNVDYFQVCFSPESRCMSGLVVNS